MKKYLFMQPALAFIAEGRLFTGVVASAVRSFAVLFALGALVGWIGLWKVVFNLEGAAILGGLLFQLIFIIGAYMIVHTMLIRGKDIQSIERSTYTVTPILSLLIRMFGEIYACVSLAVAIGGSLGILFGGYIAHHVTRFTPGVLGPQRWLFELFEGSVGTVTSALVVGLGGVISAVIWLSSAYLVAELLLAVVDIARNTDALRRGLSRGEVPSEVV